MVQLFFFFTILSVNNSNSILYFIGQKQLSITSYHEPLVTCIDNSFPTINFPQHLYCQNLSMVRLSIVYECTVNIYVMTKLWLWVLLETWAQGFEKLTARSRGRISRSGDVQARDKRGGGDGRHLVDDGLLHVTLDRLQHCRVRDRAKSPKIKTRAFKLGMIR